MLEEQEGSETLGEELMFLQEITKIMLKIMIIKAIVKVPEKRFVLPLGLDPNGG